MHLSICCHRSTLLLDGLNIYIALVNTALFRVGWRGGFSSHKYTSVSRTVGICPFVGFFLKVVLSKTLAFWKNLKVSALFLGVPIWIFVSKVCGGKSKVVDKLDVNFRTSWGFSFNQHYWRYPLLLQVCWSNPTSRLAEFLQSFCPLFTCVTGDLEF